jgi:glycosyltransferase involved in cell wall biosynthesis
MRVVVATVRTPFVYGGAEVLAEELIQALLASGHEAELVSLPFINDKPNRIPDQMLACKLTPLEFVSGIKVDRLIALKFPAYLIPHPNKIVWLMHQYRQAYDLWDHSLGDLRSSPQGTVLREIIRRADSRMCGETRALFTLSQNVTDRVRRFWNVDSMPLHHPPANANAFHCSSEPGEYIFFPSRICGNKRQELALRALALTQSAVRLKFAGAPDTPAYGERMIRLARDLRVHSRVEWLGFISEEEKRRVYAESLAVLFPPFDEDYGYITLEAMLSSKPVITCEDSGGPLEFIVPNQTGYVVPSTPEGLAAAIDSVWDNRDKTRKMGLAGRRHYDGLNLSWSKVVKRLLA